MLKKGLGRAAALSRGALAATSEAVGGVKAAAASSASAAAALAKTVAGDVGQPVAAVGGLVSGAAGQALGFASGRAWDARLGAEKARRDFEEQVFGRVWAIRSPVERAALVGRGVTDYAVRTVPPLVVQRIVSNLIPTHPLLAPIEAVVGIIETVALVQETVDEIKGVRDRADAAVAEKRAAAAEERRRAFAAKIAEMCGGEGCLATTNGFITVVIDPAVPSFEAVLMGGEGDGTDLRDLPPEAVDRLRREAPTEECRRLVEAWAAFHR